MILRDRKAPDGFERGDRALSSERYHGLSGLATGLFYCIKCGPIRRRVADVTSLQILGRGRSLLVDDEFCLIEFDVSVMG